MAARATMYNFNVFSMVFNITMWFLGSLGGFQGVAMKLLRYSKLLGCSGFLPG